jgi:biopolymer transport protein ExbB
MNVFLLAILSAAAPTTSPSSLTVWELIKSGGWVMLPLLAASFAAMFLIILYFMTLKREKVITADFQNTIEDLILKKDFSKALEVSRSNPQLVARVVERTSAFIQKNPTADFNAIREVAQAEGNKQAAALNQQVVYLMDIGVLSPMLGLFGTVIGILRSFGSIASESTPMRTMLLAGGVSQALVATAAGLVIGISCMFFYSYFRGRVQSLISELETSSTNLVASMGLNLKK